MSLSIRRFLLTTGITILIVLVLLSLLGLFYYYNLTNKRKTFHPIETQKINDNIFVIKTSWFINSWIFKTSEGYVAFDTGRGVDEIKTELKRINIDPSEVKAVFLTHSDKEHEGGVKAFPNAVFYLAKEEVQMVDGSRIRFVFFAPKNSISVPYLTLDDGQELEIGGLKIRCVLVPGHTLGSMAFIADDYLLTGDSMNMINGHAEYFNDFLFVNMDKSEMKKSISKMARLSGVNHILTTHFGNSDDFQKAFKGW
jgi:glyoxylase-like metal-dependent hydrolase (beta-lactamase superfamily II)